MAKNKSKFKEITITVRYPKKSRRWRCNCWGTVGPDKTDKWNSPYGWIARHALKDGDIFQFCPEVYCNIGLCQDHYPIHEQEHLMEKLAQDGKGILKR